VRLGLLKPDTPARFSLGSLIYFFFGVGVGDLYSFGYFFSSAFFCAALAEAIPLGEISFWYCLAAASPVTFLGISDLEAFDGDFRLGLEAGTFGFGEAITSSCPSS
jgi:hypothetical protein